jgi:predicted glycoside hydrolase/deacetylase ChbG (UPF0249 family)
MRRFLYALQVLALAIAFGGCGNDQQAQQAEASAAKAQQAAEHAEQSAAQAQAAADKATEAANRATKAVQEATVEINRVSDHLDQMARDREAATHGRRLSHVKKTARKAAADRAAVASGSPAAVPSPSAK